MVLALVLYRPPKLEVIDEKEVKDTDSMDDKSTKPDNDVAKTGSGLKSQENAYGMTNGTDINENHVSEFFGVDNKGLSDDTETLSTQL